MKSRAPESEVKLTHGPLWRPPLSLPVMAATVYNEGLREDAQVTEELIDGSQIMNIEKTETIRLSVRAEDRISQR